MNDPQCESPLTACCVLELTSEGQSNHGRRRNTLDRERPRPHNEQLLCYVGAGVRCLRARSFRRMDGFICGHICEMYIHASPRRPKRYEDLYIPPHILPP